MKILIVGATGTIGKAVADLLSQNHEVIRTGFENGDEKVDISSKESIRALFQRVGDVDAVVSAAGAASFAPLAELDDAAFDLSLNHKLMGQINLVRIGHEHLAEGGSFTLTSGVMAQKPMPGSVAISTVNAGLEAFAGAAALELGHGHRVNVVSPEFVKETMVAMGMDPESGISAADTAKAYKAAVEGNGSGATLAVAKYV